LERILDLQGEDDRARELDGAGFGVLAHAVLERFGKDGAAASVEPARVRGTLDGILAEEARARFGNRPLPAVRLQVEQLRVRLHAFAEWQAGWAGAGWRIQGVEVTPPGDGVRFEVDGDPIWLRGTLDRVDRNERSGTWCILDYKTGDRGDPPEKAHRGGRGQQKFWKDLQLPLYRRLAPALRNPEGGPLIPPEALPSLRVGFVNLPGDPRKVGHHFAEWMPHELEEAEEEARRVVRQLRENRFVFDRTHSTIPNDDPLARIVGGGVLTLEEEGEEGDALDG
jgi:ATP-dependent helicase/nuclease subunit B